MTKKKAYECPHINTGLWHYKETRSLQEYIWKLAPQDGLLRQQEAEGDEEKRLYHGRTSPLVGFTTGRR